MALTLKSKTFREELSERLGFHVGPNYNLKQAFQSLERGGRYDRRLMKDLILFLLGRVEQLEDKQK
jgi:hypothetical protein